MLVAVAVGYQLFDECVAFGCRCQHLFADFFAKRVEAAGQSHTFDGFAVAGGKVDAFDKIVDAFVGAVCFAFVDDGFDRTFAHAFDAAEPEAYDAVLIDGEGEVGFVDVRPFDNNFHGFAFVHQFGYFFDVVFADGEIGSHKFGGEIGFQIGRLVGQPSVAGRVRFVERIFGKFEPCFPNAVQYRCLITVLFAAFDKFRIEFVQQRGYFFTHGFA